MFCRYCGKETEDNVAYCPSCGKCLEDKSAIRASLEQEISSAGGEERLTYLQPIKLYMLITLGLTAVFVVLSSIASKMSLDFDLWYGADSVTPEWVALVITSGLMLIVTGVVGIIALVFAIVATVKSSKMIADCTASYRSMNGKSIAIIVYIAIIGVGLLVSIIYTGCAVGMFAVASSLTSSFDSGLLITISTVALIASIGATVPTIIALVKAILLRVRLKKIV